MSAFKNNTGNKGKQELIEGFVVRTKPFKLIFREIASSNSDKPEQNYLIIGQRGAGKTTLLYRLKYEIEDKLTKKWGVIPVMLSEEQYNVRELLDLWEYVAELLEDHNYFTGIYQRVNSVKAGNFQESEAFKILENTLIESNKKLIIFIENIDAFFKKIGTPGQKRLREILSSSHHVRVIASSTAYFEGVTDYSMPFYEFFKVIELKGLTLPESKELLLSIGAQYGEKEKIQRVISKTPKRLESLRRLTGGVPRTISYLFDIFLGAENGKAIKDLHKLLDDLTALYKSELDQLSPLQQKVVDAIARNWDAIAVKDISQKTRIESKQVSSILNSLEKNQVVEVINTKSKNNLYRIRERFMNIWYLMRFGKLQDRENVLWLVRFYDAWCDKSELTQHIQKHLKNLADGKYDLTTALHMANTFLACENVPADLRYSIYKMTKAVWPKKSLELLYSDRDLYEHVRGLIKQKKFPEAIRILESHKKEDDDYYLNMAVFVHASSGDYVKAEQYSERLFQMQPDNGFAAYRIGIFNEYNLGNEDKAIQFYKKALSLKEYKAGINLGDLYLKNENEEKALEYYLIASEHKVSEAYMQIATIYFNSHKLELAEEFCKKAVGAKKHYALINLGLISELKLQFSEAESYYEQAIAKNIHEALIPLGKLELSKPNPDHKKGISYLKKAYEKKLDGSAIALAKAYLRVKTDEKKGLSILKKESTDGNSSAAHTLGHYYSDKGMFEESDKYFKLSFDLGRKGAAICHAFELLVHNRTDKRKAALSLIEENLNILETSGFVSKIMYAVVLLWNDEIERSKEFFVKEVLHIRRISELNLDKLTGSLLEIITSYFKLLIAKGLMNVAYGIFMEMQDIDLKNIIKPVYYALMNFMKDEFPKEHLKAGDELKDTILEIVAEIDKLRKSLRTTIISDKGITIKA